MTSTASSTRARPAPRHRTSATHGWAAVPYIAPALVLYSVFLAYPIIDAVRLSFFKWNGFATSPAEYVGLDNYRWLFTFDPVFWRAFSNTIVWVVLSLIVPVGLSLLIAVALNRQLAGRNAMRSIFYIPNVLASIAVASMWRWIYHPVLGLINETLAAVGLGAWSQQWLADPRIALYSVFIAFVWQVTGFNMVLFLAGLQNVPRELVEAATIDGAGAFRTFRFVTLPALRPTTVVVVVLTVIGSLKVFDLIVGMTGGGPAQSTQVLALWLYTLAFGNHDFGNGSAVATILLLLSLALVVPYLAWSLRRSE